MVDDGFIVVLLCLTVIPEWIHFIHRNHRKGFSESSFVAFLDE